MSRTLTIRPPTADELAQIHQRLEQPLQGWQRRRLEIMLLYAAGHTAQDIAALVGVHINTVYSDLRHFQRQRCRAVQQRRRQGAPARLSRQQRLAIWRLAEQSPTELGLPYGRWSLTKLRAYLARQGIVPSISREHLRRVLKKGGTHSAASSASCPAKTPIDAVFSTAYASCGSIGHVAAGCCFSMSSR